MHPLKHITRFDAVLRKEKRLGHPPPSSQEFAPFPLLLWLVWPVNMVKVPSLEYILMLLLVNLGPWCNGIK